MASRLRAGLMLALDPDPRLSDRDRADVTRLARHAGRTSRRMPRPELAVPVAQRAELVPLARRAGAALGEETSGLLEAWLRTP
ncbi:hypothetical protein [Micromonospora sp. IBHARD004]|uniref:hypothetical protein n=1 Tax=Micromonospora sp. IBHARD004 TaxID=3457764 RepID=UPI00405A0058